MMPTRSVPEYYLDLLQLSLSWKQPFQDFFSHDLSLLLLSDPPKYWDSQTHFQFLLIVFVYYRSQRYLRKPLLRDIKSFNITLRFLTFSLSISLVTFHAN